MTVSRRHFFQSGLASVGAATLTLRADAAPTLPSGHLDHYLPFRILAETPLSAPAMPAAAKPTEDNILGPYYREGSPFRGKITPPLEKGVVMVIRGRVWGFDTRKPLSGAVLDIWQANADGRYDNDDPASPPAKGVFVNRARLLTDETGYYEYETVHPGPYKTGPNSWRPSHIHYLVRHPGYKTLVTQLYFAGDRHNAADDFIKASLVITLKQSKVNAQAIETGEFDVVLAAGK